MRRAGIWISILLLSVGLVFAGSPKVARDLQNKKPGERVDVIVQFKDAPTAKQHDKVKSRRGTMKAELGLVQGGAYSLPAEELESLAADPDVAFISPDREVKATLDNATPTVWNGLAQNYNYNGTGIAVAVIDSGMNDFADLRYAGKTTSRIVYNQDFTGSGWTTDDYGHGSHVAYILGSNATWFSGPEFTKSFRGVAPNVKLVNLKVLNAQGVGTDSWVIAAIDKAIALKKTYNIRVINLSLGRPVAGSYLTDPLCLAVEKAWKAGIVVVVAAGNEGRNYQQGTEGYSTITAPGNDPYVITVGAMKTMGTPSRTDDYVASYSSKGPSLIDHIVKPDLVAPGNRIIAVRSPMSVLGAQFPNALVPNEYWTTNQGWAPQYMKLSGTSMATPLVSGAVALMLQKTSALTPDQVKARLMKSASKAFPASSVATDPETRQSFTSQYDIFTVGAGYLDIPAALTNTDLASKPARSPKADYDAATGNVYLTTVDGTALIWGDSTLWSTSRIWGNALVWGNSLIWGNSRIWGDAAIWGNDTTSGFSAIWGNAAIWGNGVPTGEALNVVTQGED